MNNSLGAAKAAQIFARKFYENGAMPSGVLETEQVLKQEVRDGLKQAWASQYSGAENAGKTPVLEAGIKYKELTLPMSDMQFIETRRFQKEEIASWFRMPLYKLQEIGRAQGWSTLDAQETDYVGSCLLPWVLRLEQEIKRQLMQNYDAEVYPHFELKGLMRGDAKTRAEFCNAMQDHGAMTPNERRMYEDMEPIDDPAAEKLYINSTMIPLEDAGQAQTDMQQIGGAKL
jgi:HK97 family phage portal protein